MNERIVDLAKQAGLRKPYGSDREYISDLDWRLFAELMVQEHIKVLQQQWYDANNEAAKENESPRDVGIRVGRKSQLVASIEQIKKHFGVES